MKKRSTYPILVLFVLIVAAYAPQGHAEDAPANQVSTQTESARMSKRFGAYLGVGEPSPGIVGVNLGYNLIDAIRLTAGFGHISVSGFGMDSSATTLAAGVVGMVPGWSLTPTLGVHYAQVIYSGDGSLQVGGFTQSGGHVYGSAGLDYQAKNGFNGGIGYNHSFAPGVDSSFYLQAGWFFDLLS